MRTMIVNGGNIDKDFALAFLRNTTYDYLLAADKGMEFVKAAGLIPDEIVGDFDSAGQEMLRYYQEKGIPIRRFRPQKDSTDMEIAMLTAMERGSSSITVLGATGTRIDHVLGSIRNLSIPLKQGVPCCLVDSHNRIRMLGDGKRHLELKKSEQFGKYVSLLAHGGPVRKLTLEGFFYPLRDYTLEADSALGVSNEIVEETAEIFFESGRLLVIESRD